MPLLVSYRAVDAVVRRGRIGASGPCCEYAKDKKKEGAGAHLVPRIGVGLQVKFDVAHGVREDVEALLRVGEERPAGNDHLPTAVPSGAADQPTAGEGARFWEGGAIRYGA